MTEEHLSLPQALETVGLAKSTRYYRPRTRQPQPLNPALIQALEAVGPTGRGVYGYRKIHAALTLRCRP